MKESFFENKTIYICSPLHDEDEAVELGNQKKAESYAKEYEDLYECRAIAPHAWLPHLLVDAVEEERALAMEISLRLLDRCDAIVVVGNRLSSGMCIELDHALLNGIPIVSRPENFEQVMRYLDNQKSRSLPGKGGGPDALHLREDDL